MAMYNYVGSDGNWHPADLNRLKEWARLGHVEPYAPVMDIATGKQTRADAILELQPVFAARFEAMAKQKAEVANAVAATAANSQPQAPKKDTFWAWGGTIVVLIVLGIARGELSDWLFHRPREYPPRPSVSSSSAPSQIQDSHDGLHDGAVKPEGAQYLAGPMPEKERKRIFWEIGMAAVNAEKAEDKRFPTLRLSSRHPNAAEEAKINAYNQRAVAYGKALEEQNKNSLAKRSKLTRNDLDLIFNEGMNKEWPSPYATMRFALTSATLGKQE